MGSTQARNEDETQAWYDVFVEKRTLVSRLWQWLGLDLDDELERLRRAGPKAPSADEVLMLRGGEQS